jgi:hypothetical protein
MKVTHGPPLLVVGIVSIVTASRSTPLKSKSLQGLFPINGHRGGPPLLQHAILGSLVRTPRRQMHVLVFVHVHRAFVSGGVRPEFFVPGIPVRIVRKDAPHKSKLFQLFDALGGHGTRFVFLHQSVLFPLIAHPCT